MKSKQDTRSKQKQSYSLRTILITALVLVAFLFFSGIIFIHGSDKSKASLEQFTAIIDKLEQEHIELRKLVSAIDKEATEKMHEVISLAAQHKKQDKGRILVIDKIPTAPVGQAISTENLEVIKPLQYISSTPFPPAITFSTTNAGKRPAMLVVGGTDGSGTRRVVQILTQLGVTMVSEDPETYDIHGDLMGGWPQVVKPVLQHTRSLVYDPATFPRPLYASVSNNLERLVDQAEADSLKPQSFILAKGGALPKGTGLSASLVKYGFKAPVSMTLAPWWAALTSDFKFLHVLRDGRDIAFSDNQGPVEKFYADMYPAVGHELLPLKAIKLWSDWNTQAYNWAKAYIDSSSNRPDKSFGYFALHSEDLVSDSVAVRFAALSHLSEWVGSDIKNDRLCCLAVLDAEFLGSHDRGARKTVKSEEQLSSRYGKWRGKVAHSSQMNATLHAMGGPGLKLFGYEPMRELASPNARSKSGFKCELTEAQCSQLDPGYSDRRLAAAKWAVPGMCDTFAGRDYKGDGHSDIMALDITDRDPSECCRRCKSIVLCKHFTIDPTNNYCYLKSGKGVVDESLNSVHLVSGDIV